MAHASRLSFSRAASCSRSRNSVFAKSPVSWFSVSFFPSQCNLRKQQKRDPAISFSLSGFFSLSLSLSPDLPIESEFLHGRCVEDSDFLGFPSFHSLTSSFAPSLTFKEKEIREREGIFLLLLLFLLLANCVSFFREFGYALQFTSECVCM